MGSHPINLGVRFLLELAALMSYGMWGYKFTDGWPRYVLALAIPVVFAALWGIFAVPDDPSRSGAAPVVTPGLIRLLLELLFFACATWALYDMGMHKSGLALGIIVILHYIISYDRILWLLAR